jgi:hypothetical protein
MLGGGRGGESLEERLEGLDLLPALPTPVGTWAT